MSIFGFGSKKPDKIIEALEDDESVISDHISSIDKYLKSKNSDKREKALKCYNIGLESDPQLVAERSSLIVEKSVDDSYNVQREASKVLAKLSDECPRKVIANSENIETVDTAIVAEKGLIRRNLLKFVHNLSLVYDEPIINVENSTRIIENADNKTDIIITVKILSNLEKEYYDSLDIDVIVNLLEHDNVDVQKFALKFIRTYIIKTEVMADVPIENLSDCLDNKETQLETLDLLTTIINNTEYPSYVSELHGEICEYMKSDYNYNVRTSTHNLYDSYIRNFDSYTVRDITPYLIDFYEDVDEDNVKKSIVSTLTFLTSENPEPIAENIEIFERGFKNSNLEHHQPNVVMFHNLTFEAPNYVEEYVPDFNDKLGNPEFYIQRHAARSIWVLSTEIPEIKEKYDIDGNRVYDILRRDEETPNGRAEDFRRYYEESDMESDSEEEHNYISDKPTIDFDDYVGKDELKRTAMKRIIEPLENPDLYGEFGLDIQRGFIFYGPPGTGKTYFGKALGGECDFHYIQVDAADLVSKWIGQGAKNVNKMFEQAVDNQPCIIFIDEIDSLATSRATRQTKSERQLVNQILQGMTKINDNKEDVIVIGATNRIEDVDNALLRSGRMGEKIEFGYPEGETRIEILKRHTKPPIENIDEDWIIEKTDNFSQSDMAKLSEESSYEAMERYKQGDYEDIFVKMEDIREAVNNMNENTKVSDEKSSFRYIN